MWTRPARLPACFDACRRIQHLLAESFSPQIKHRYPMGLRVAVFASDQMTRYVAKRVLAAFQRSSLTGTQIPKMPSVMRVNSQ